MPEFQQQEDLQNVIVQAAQGSEEAFTVLWTQITKRVLFSCIKIIGNQYDAEDAAQEIFVKMKMNITKLKEPKTFNLWLSKIIMNTCIDIKRKTERGKQDVSLEKYEDVIESSTQSDMPSISLENNEISRTIRKVISELPFSYRAVMIFYYYDNLSQKEIAQTMNTTVNSIEHILRRARAKMKKALINEFGEKVTKEELYLGGMFPVISGFFLKESEEMLPEIKIKMFQKSIESSLAKVAIGQGALPAENVSGNVTGKIIQGTALKGPITIIVASALVLGVGGFLALYPPNFLFPKSSSEETSFVPQQSLVKISSEGDLDIYDSTVVSFFNAQNEVSTVNPQKAIIKISDISEELVSWEIYDMATDEIMKTGSGLEVTAENLSLPANGSVKRYGLRITAVNKNNKSITTEKEFIITG